MAPAKTVTVEACVTHTYHGQSYTCGDTYEADCQDLESLEVQGKATRVGPAAEKGAYKTTAVTEKRTTDLKAKAKKK